MFPRLCASKEHTFVLLPERWLLGEINVLLYVVFKVLSHTVQRQALPVFERQLMRVDWAQNQSHQHFTASDFSSNHPAARGNSNLTSPPCQG